MRRTLALLLGVLFLAGIAVTPAFAASPAPKVTIEGFIDNTTVWSKNASVLEIDITRNADKEWYSRTRARLQVTGEVGATKLVLLFEQDNNWGSLGGQCYGMLINNSGDSSLTTVGNLGHFGTRDGCLNSEYTGNVEGVWLFAEFPLTGKGSLLPFIPVPGFGRVGIQPFDNDTYKLGVLAFGNFAGAHIDIDAFPGVKFTGTFAQVDEGGTGFSTFSTSQERGDDLALLFSVEVSPTKGIDLKPLFAYMYIDGNSVPVNDFGTSNLALGYGPRTGKGGVADRPAFFPRGAVENRYTVGLDGRMKFGAFSIEPTILYQFGTREITPFGDAANGLREQNMSAWFVDLRGGWQAGPFTLEALGMYTTGNKAEDDLPSGGPDVKYYQPIDTNAVYGVEWGAITAITYEYITQLYYGQTGLCPSCSIGYDKYGRIQGALRAKYAVTPDFVLRGLVSALWTAQQVNTASNVGGPNGGTNQAINGGGLYAVNAAQGGNAQYFGTEFNIGFEWGFAPNIRLLALYGHLFSGDALDVAGSVRTETGTSARTAEDVDLGSLTLRFTF